MSVIGEVVGIVACVAAVCSAYKDGSSIINKIKVKRALKRATPPSRLLEESIDQAPEEIEREKQRGIARFGRSFEEGDHIVVIALQQITIQLQKSLLEKLRNAAYDDEVTDFRHLVDAADLGRDQTIGTLLEFRQRLLLSAPIEELPTVAGSENRKPTLVQPTQLALQAPKPAQPSSVVKSAKHSKTWNNESSTSAQASGDESHATRKRHSSLFGFLNKHHRSQSGSGDSIPIAAEGANHRKSTLATPPYRPPTAHSPKPQSSTPSFTYQEWEDNPAEIWGSKPANSRTKSIALAPDQPSSPTSSSRSMSTASGHPMALTRSTSGQIPTPTPENNYLGFCKGAWRLQNGDRKGIQKCKEFNDGWSQSSVYYLTCASSKCAFACRGAIDSIWIKVWTIEKQGIKLRWPFLAKSHVSQQKVKDHQYAYMCMFCVFLGQPTPVIHGTDYYLEHIQTHRDQDLSEVILYRTNCIQNRVADDEETFDINLWPINTAEQSSRKQSAVLSDDLLDDVPRSRADSGAQDPISSSNEPWNDGLSNFQWDGDNFESGYMA